MLAAIRAVDPRGMVWHEPFVTFNQGGGTSVHALGDPNVGFSFHDYCISAERPGSDAACAKSDDLVFQHALDRVASTKEALLLTEFGATDAASVLRPMVERADRTMVSWVEWHYCGCDDPTTSGPGDKQAIVLDPSRPPTGDNLKTVTLDQLVRPYPQVVAGTPESWSYGDGTFQARWTAQGKGESEIVLPARVYPKGYAARVQGGSISSAKGDRLLRVIACAPEVAVTVTRTGSTNTTCKAPPLRVTVRPKRVRAGKRVRLTITVRPAIGGAVVRVAGKRAQTDAKGRAHVRVRLARSGHVTVRSGSRFGRATVLRGALMSDVVLGLDVGTTSAKATAFDPTGRTVGHAEVTYPPFPPGEQDPGVVVDAAARVVQEAARPCARSPSRSAPRCTGSSALDGDGRALTPLLTWADTRAAAQAERLQREHPDLHDRTGTPLHPMSPLPKLVWFRELGPRCSRRRGAGWGSRSSCCTGSPGAGWSTGRSRRARGCSSSTTLDWDAEALEIAGIGRRSWELVRDRRSR